ncbi:MAG: SDR family NAD(P)-dependent oxidoreductase [Acetobacteraceae bacterium]|nr:SDR family NAD(P)-dependent oxidoreductase [Acetobacteraceae bacterium]
MTHHETHHAGGRPLAVVTGASTGIGYELAKLCVEHGHDLVIAADQPQIHDAASEFRGMGAMVEPVQADLATDRGVESLLAAIGRRPVAVLMANAGHGLGGAFLDQNPAEWRHVVDTNITGTLLLIQKVAQEMRGHGEGKILITGSIAGFTPGTFQAVYNGTKAFIDSFSWALRNELQDTGVTVTCLMPGATETEFFERAGMEDTKVGASKKDDPKMVAETGYAAMERGDGDIVAGWHNKIATALASITPAAIGAAVHRRGAEPGSAKS